MSEISREVASLIPYQRKCTHSVGKGDHQGNPLRYVRVQSSVLSMHLIELDHHLPVLALLECACASRIVIEMTSGNSLRNRLGYIPR